MKSPRPRHNPSAMARQRFRMRAFETIQMVRPPTPQAWGRGVAVVAAFLLAEDARGFGLGLEPVIVAFWVNLLIIMAGNWDRMRRTMHDFDVSLCVVIGVWTLVLGGLYLISLMGSAAVLVAWVGYFAFFAVLKMWLATCDLAFARQYYGVEESQGEALATCLMIEAVSVAVTAACLAAIAHSVPNIAFVAFATFGWFVVSFFGNWISVLVLLQTDEHDQV